MFGNVCSKVLIVAICLLPMTAVGQQVQAQAQDLYPEPKRGDTVLKRLRPATDAKGMPIGGGWRVYPELDLSARYDDNIFAEQTHKKDDVVVVARPSISVTNDGAFGLIAAEVYGDLEYHKDYTSEDAKNFGAEAAYQSAQDQRFKVEARTGFRRITQDRADPEERILDERSELDRYFGRIAMRYDFGRLQIGAGGEARRIDFRQGFNDDRDRKEYLGHLDLRFIRTESTSLYVSPRWRSVRYDEMVDRTGINRNRDEGGAVLGVQLDFGGILIGTVEMGATKLWFDDPAFDDKIFFSAAAGLDWNVTRLTTVSFEAERAPHATVQIASPIRVDSLVGVAVNHELKRNIIISLGASYINQKFQNIGRSDDVMEYTAGIDYRLNRYIHMKLDYAYRDRSSDLDTIEFSRNRISLGFRLQI